jgi:hypothetical protein
LYAENTNVHTTPFLDKKERNAFEENLETSPFVIWDMLDHVVIDANGLID